MNLYYEKRLCNCNLRKKGLLWRKHTNTSDFSRLQSLPMQPIQNKHETTAIQKKNSSVLWLSLKRNFNPLRHSGKRNGTLSFISPPFHTTTKREIFSEKWKIKSKPLHHMPAVDAANVYPLLPFKLAHTVYTGTVEPWDAERLECLSQVS